MEMMRLSERREASGSQPDTRPGQLRMAQAQHGGWSLEAKGRSAGTAGHADPGDLQTQATARLGGPGEQRAPHLPPPVAKVTRRPLIAQEDMRLWAPHGVFSVQPAKVLSFFLTWFPWFLVSLLCCLLKKKTRRLMS